MECVIISGGNISTDFALDFLNRKTDVLLIAADRGLEFCSRNGILPDWAVGDFDSVSKAVLEDLGLLSYGEKNGVSVSIADQNNYICLLTHRETILEREKQFGKYVSFFPVWGEVEGLTLRGFKYSLNKYHLTVFDSGLTVSNEIVDKRASIEFEKGPLLMVMSRD